MKVLFHQKLEHVKSNLFVCILIFIRWRMGLRYIQYRQITPGLQDRAEPDSWLVQAKPRLHY